jgi:hypothetical protein
MEIALKKRTLRGALWYLHDHGFIISKSTELPFVPIDLLLVSLDDGIKTSLPNVKEICPRCENTLWIFDGVETFCSSCSFPLGFVTSVE